MEEQVATACIVGIARFALTDVLLHQYNSMSLCSPGAGESGARARLASRTSSGATSSVASSSATYLPDFLLAARSIAMS